MSKRARSHYNGETADLEDGFQDIPAKRRQKSRRQLARTKSLGGRSRGLISRGKSRGRKPNDFPEVKQCLLCGSSLENRRDSGRFPVPVQPTDSQTSQANHERDVMAYLEDIGKAPTSRQGIKRRRSPWGCPTPNTNIWQEKVFCLINYLVENDSPFFDKFLGRSLLYLILMSEN